MRDFRLRIYNVQKSDLHPSIHNAFGVSLRVHLLHKIKLF